MSRRFRPILSCFLDKLYIKGQLELMTKSLNHVYSQPFKTPATLADTDELETDFKELRKWLEKSTR